MKKLVWDVVQGWLYVTVAARRGSPPLTSAIIVHLSVFVHCQNYLDYGSDLDYISMIQLLIKIYKTIPPIFQRIASEEKKGLEVKNWIKFTCLPHYRMQANLQNYHIKIVFNRLSSSFSSFDS